MKFVSSECDGEIHVCGLKALGTCDRIVPESNLSSRSCTGHQELGPPKRILHVCIESSIVGDSEAISYRRRHLIAEQEVRKGNEYNFNGNLKQ